MQASRAGELTSEQGWWRWGKRYRGTRGERGPGRRSGGLAGGRRNRKEAAELGRSEGGLRSQGVPRGWSKTRGVSGAACECTQVSERSRGENRYPQSAERLMIYLRPHRRG